MAWRGGLVSAEPSPDSEGLHWDLGYGFDDLVLYSERTMEIGVSEPVQIMPKIVIDLGRLSTWLQECETKHASSCGLTTSKNQRSRSTGLLLVDVSRSCIVESSTDDRYLALSYVWGGVSQFMTTTKTLPRLLEPQALSSCDLSTTVIDAMSVVAGLGERYLWVDTLCIVQDDMAKKQSAIDSMAAIYSSAVCTIVAVSAVDANSGLPGVRPHTRILTKHVEQTGIWICGVNDDQSTYYSRGWTYQEALLSRRCLLFGGQRAEFRCSHSTRREDRLDALPSEVWGERSVSVPTKPSFDHFGDMVSTYSERRLSYRSDRLNAFAGVLQELEEKWAWSFCHGIPATHIHAALLWVSLKSCMDDDPEPHPITPSPFPSWSWACAPRGVTFAHALCSLRNLRATERTLALATDPDTRNPAVRFVGEVVRLDSFNLDPPSHGVYADCNKESADADTTAVHDSKGSWCGLLVGVTREELSGFKTEELVLLALSTYDQEKVASADSFWTVGALKYEIEHPFDIDVFEQHEQTTINVLLVHLVGETPVPRARRVAVGEIHKNAWMRATGERREVYLV